MGKLKWEFPFEIPWDDVRMEITTPEGHKCYICDTCVVTDPEERAQIDRNVAAIILRSEQKKRLRRMKEEEESTKES